MQSTRRSIGAIVEDGRSTKPCGGGHRFDSDTCMRAGK